MRPSLTLAILLFSLSSTFGAERPNILLITADDLGTQLSCYGDPIAKTPEIDRLASESVRFRTAYISQASCSPSRSSMLTGLYPHANGQYGLLNANVGFRVHEKYIDALLPNLLKSRGYRTGIIGKLHVGPEKAFQFDLRTGEGFGGRDVRLQVDFARKFIAESGETPWFLMFNLFDPHVARQRRANGSRGPQYFPDQVKGLPKEILSADDIAPWPWQQVDTPAQRKKIAGYYNCVHRIDAAIGQLRSVLDEAGAWEETLLIFLGDHGPPFTRGKTSCYEAGLRVPFIVRWPGVSQAHLSSSLVSSVDIVPTILDAASIIPAENLHGRSLRSVLKRDGGSAAWRDTLVAEFHYHGASPFFPRRAITDGRFKLIHNLRASEANASGSVDGDSAASEAAKLPKDNPARLAMERLVNPPEWELYDLQSDPVEFNDLSEDNRYAEAKTRLQAALERWQDETEDPFRDPDFRTTTEEQYRPKR